MSNETVPVAAPIIVLINHGEKSEKFNGIELKRWQQKNVAPSHNTEFDKILVWERSKSQEKWEG